MANVKMTRGINSLGRIISIENVDSGLQQDCFCLDCAARLVANKGQIRAKHFSHYPEDAINNECHWGYETELHLLAKEIISENKQLTIPIGSFEPYYTTITFDKVSLESRSGNRIPDLTGFVQGDIIHIEIAVTHFCDQHKIAELKEKNISCVEIDLSELIILGEFIDKDLVRKELENPKIKWLSISPFSLFADKTYSHNRLKSIELIQKIKAEKDQIESDISLLQRKLTELQHKELTLSKSINSSVDILERNNLEIERRTEELDILYSNIKDNKLLADKILNAEKLELQLNEKILTQLDLIKKNDIHSSKLSEFKNKLLNDSRDIARNREQELQDLDKKITEILDREKTLDQRYKDINIHIEKKANEIVELKFNEILKSKQNIISEYEIAIKDAEAKFQLVKRKYGSYIKF